MVFKGEEKEQYKESICKSDNNVNIKMFWVVTEE